MTDNNIQDPNRNQQRQAGGTTPQQGQKKDQDKNLGNKAKGVDTEKTAQQENGGRGSK